MTIAVNAAAESVQQISNLPNASKLFSSLRHLDYNSLSAIADIVDNSIDAGATCVHIRLHSESKKNIDRIDIYDNGKGMDYETLVQAMKLGSETNKNPEYDLGLYGMGLITASISIGEKLEVKTLHEPYSHTLYAVQDLEEIYESNDFLINIQQYVQPTSFLKELQDNMDDYIEKNDKPIRSGTKVSISKIDNWNWVLLDASRKKLKEHLAQAFRKFLQSGKKIIVDNEIVTPLDPIHDYEPTLLGEEKIEFEKGAIIIKVFELKDYGGTINKEKEINIQNQGFYILRNNREISIGETLGLFSKHNDLNLFRAELVFPATLDNELSLGFSKQKININQSLSDKISRFVTPYTKQVRARANKKHVDNREKKENFSEVEKFITQKSHLLKTPKAEVEQRSPKKLKTEDKVNNEINKRGPRLDIIKRKRIDISSLKVKFATKSLEDQGPLYTADMDKDITVISWNVDHPFYKDIIIRHEADKDIFNSICFLVYSLAVAELRSKIDSDSELIINNIRYDFSRNLAILLK